MESVVESETLEADVSEEQPSTSLESTETSLFELADDYKAMELGDVAEVDDFYITLNHVKRVATTYSALGYADEIDSSHEVIIGFFEFYNASDEIQTARESNITAYADDVEVKEVNSYYLFSEDGVDELHSYEIDAGSACMMIVNFEVPKDWSKFELYYKSDCVWSFDSEQIGEDGYDGQIILQLETTESETPAGYVLDMDDLEATYDGYEFYTYNNVVYGDETYIVYKYTLTNNGSDVYENSLVGYNMRGYCNNYLLDSASYTMTDKIGEYINIYELEKIQAGKSIQVYVAFEIEDSEADYYMAFDMGYIVNELVDKIYASTK